PDDGVGGFGGLQELAGLNKPVVAAVNGIAIGGGMEMVLACDMVLAAEHTRFALPEIKLGGMPDAAAVRLPRRIPHAVAMEMMLTGRWMDAREALRWGIVNEIVPPNALLERAREVSRMIAEAPPLAVAAIKETVRETEALALQDGLSRVSKRRLPAVARLYASEDIKEGRRAAAQKRKPDWRGR
ncbi:MAG: enoyl-CoA hydratase-related protein, partial [Flavobacteriaceae bacterium]